MRRHGFERHHLADRTDVYDRYIPFLQGRPQRLVAIDSDDVLNLIIALHTCRSLDDFLETV